MDDIPKDNWKEADLNVDSLWIISERDKSGKHANVYSSESRKKCFFGQSIEYFEK